MKKKIDIEEYIGRYAESAVISAVRLRRYWMKQGNTDDEATTKAVNQAIGMLAASGIPPKKLMDLFSELEGAAKAFQNILAEVEGSKTSPKKSRTRQ